MNLFTRKSRRVKTDPEHLVEHTSGPDDSETAPTPAERSLVARSRQRIQLKKADDPLQWRSGWHAQLLPATIADQARARRAHKLTVAASITFILLLSLAQTSQLLLNQQATQRVEDAQADLEQVSSQWSELTAAADLEQLLTDSESLAEMVFASENDPGAVLSTMVAAAGSEDATFDTVTLSVGHDGEAGLLHNDEEDTLGTFTVTGQTPDTVAVFELAERLEQLPAVSSVNIDNYSEAGETVSFAISGQLTAAAGLGDTNGQEGQN